MTFESAPCTLCEDIITSYDNGMICPETPMALCSECIVEYFSKYLEDFEKEECFCLYEENYKKAIEALIINLKEKLDFWEDKLTDLDEDEEEELVTILDREY